MSNQCQLYKTGDKITVDNIVYIIDTFLAKGGFGTIYKVKTDSNKFYVMKIIPTELFIGDPLKEKQFSNEINTAQHFKVDKQPVCKAGNVSCYIASGTDKKKDPCFKILISPLYEGGALTTITDKNLLDEPLTDNLFISYVDQIINGIKQLHELGIYHGDLKPDNILLNKLNTKLALIDFDTICKVGEPCEKLGSTDFYASPIFNKTKYEVNIDPTIIRISDLWALANIVLELRYGTKTIRDLQDQGRPADIISKAISYYDNIGTRLTNIKLFVNEKEKSNDKIRILLKCMIELMQIIAGTRKHHKSDFATYYFKITPENITINGIQNMFYEITK